jgi:hypothetical protein
MSAITPPAGRLLPVRLRRALRRWLPLALLIAAIAVTYFYIASAGKWVGWPTYTSYGDYLAEGFRSGHLYLARPTPPQLLAAKNPFDPINLDYWLWDASYHNGRFYLYWGPVPALVQAGVKAVLHSATTFGDQYSVFVSCTLRLIVGVLLISRMARRLFPGLPAALLGLAMLVFAYANPTPWILARGAIYESAIGGGQAFLVAGLLFAFEAVWKRDAGRPARPTLVAAGAAWSLAISCRVSLAPTVLLVALATAWLAGTRADLKLWRRIAGDLVALGVPLAITMALLLAYNKARFESWFEFGTGQQLSTMSYRGAKGYMPANLYSYLLRPLRMSCRFPFVKAPWNIDAAGFPSWLRLREGYGTAEPAAGVLIAIPWVWLGLGALPTIVRDLRRRRRAAGDAGLDQHGRATAWCLLAFLLVANISILPVMPLFIATMRYIEDISAGITLFGILGAWTLYSRVKSRPRVGPAVLALEVVVGTLTIAIGVLLGFHGYDNHFQKFNPPLWEHLVRTLSLCQS